VRPGLSYGAPRTRIGSTEQLAKGSIRQSGDSHRRLPPVVSGLQHFHRLASPATFPPTECLMTPVSYSPRAALRASDVRTRPRSPSRCLPGRAGVLFRRPVPPSAWDRRFSSKQSLAPARMGWGNAPGPTTGALGNQRQPLGVTSDCTNLCRSVSEQLHKRVTRSADALGPCHCKHCSRSPSGKAALCPHAYGQSVKRRSSPGIDAASLGGIPDERFA
jgi:hypothetical protein